MKPARLAGLALLSLLTVGCTQYEHHQEMSKKHYRKIRVSDTRGDLVSEWIAEGSVTRTGVGYRFKALERRTAPPYPQDIRFPEGRLVEIGGENIFVAPCGKPEWLYQRDGF